MVEKDRLRSDSWYLDKKKENKLFFRFVFTVNGKGLEEFAVSYWTIIDEKPYEIVRYDCSARETVHIHQFFYKRPKKRKLDKEIGYDTMLDFIEIIEKNWRQYLAKFREK